jgi:hypothetical protein
MTSSLHSTIFPPGFPLDASEFDQRRSELDQAICDIEASGSGWATTLDAQAASGQKVVPVTTTVGAVVGMPVFIGVATGLSEVGVIDSIQAGISVTMVDLLTYTYAAGVYITATPYEVWAARAGYATLLAHFVADEANITLLLARHALLGIRYVLAGTVLYTPTAGAVSAWLELIGAGAGGGSVATAVTNAGAGGGGGGGGYSTLWIASLAASYACIVGAGGAGGAGGAANAGTAGADTTFGTAGALAVAKGGAGGAGDTIAAGPRAAGSGGAGGAAASGTGDSKMSGGSGGTGMALAAAHAISGGGGQAAGIGGGGGKGLKTQNDGSPGGIYGGGGAGGCAVSGGVTQAGGAGADGLLRIWEYR